MSRFAPWLVRSGALLILLAPFLPQVEAGGQAVGPGRAVAALEGKGDAVERLAVAGGLYAPVLIAVVLLAGSALPGGGPAALRAGTLVLLLAASFALSTLGSILLTDPTPRSGSPSFPLLIALFAAPLLLSGIALARWMQGGLGRSTGTFERGALAALLFLQGLILADGGWAGLLAAGGIPNGTLRLLAGAWVGPAGALLAAAGAALAAISPRAVVDSAPASG
jgi:hypothetical protein